jgi:hypothetical protein
MLQRRLRILAGAVATAAAVMLGGSKSANADVLLTVTAGGTTDNFDFGSNAGGTTGVFTIDGYTAQFQTVVTDYPGSPSSVGGFISTTVNITGAVTQGVSAPLGKGDTLTSTVQLVASPINFGSPFANTLLGWTAPSSTPVVVGAGASFSNNPATVTSGLVTDTTYYDSPPAGTFAASTPVVSATQNPPNNTGNSTNTTLKPNVGTYSLSQTLVLSGINVGAAGFNYGGTSSVTPTPEPSSLALAGIGVLGMIGYSLRRRKAQGA